MHFILVIILSFINLSVFAGEINNLTHEEFLRNEQILQAATKEKLEFTKYKQAANKSLKNYQELINEAKKRATYHLNRNNVSRQTKLSSPTPKAIIFVSFSMPDLSLKQIIKDAARYQIPVVVRGLIANSFKKTAARIFELVKGNNQGGIAINPIWFKRYSINAVPACVVSVGEDFDVIYGNLRIKNMLEIVTANGTTGTIAKTILAGGKG